MQKTVHDDAIVFSHTASMWVYPMLASITMLALASGVFVYMRKRLNRAVFAILYPICLIAVALPIASVRSTFDRISISPERIDVRLGYRGLLGSKKIELARLQEVYIVDMTGSSVRSGSIFKEFLVFVLPDEDVVVPVHTALGEEARRDMESAVIRRGIKIKPRSYFR